MNAKIIENFFVFFSASFSGGYKIFAVFLITLLFPVAVVQEFNTYYFIVLICVSLGVMPLASMMTAQKFSLTGLAKLVWLMLFSVTACGVVVVFQNELAIRFDVNLFIALLVSVFFVGGYEIARRELANSRSFRQVFICGVITTLLFLLIFFAERYQYSDPISLILFFSICFGLPVFGSVITKQREASFFGGVKPFQFLKNYTSACISNSSSSLIAYLLPLTLVALLQSEISPYLAVIFSAANLFMLVPRYMAEKNIPLMRNGGDLESIADKTFFSTLVYLALIFLCAFIVFVTIDIRDFWLYFLLFSSMQLTQLTLPYSNVLMVNNKFSLLLKINILGLMPYALLLLMLFYSVSNFQMSYMIVFSYILSSVMKTILTRTYCQPIFRPRGIYETLSDR